MLECTHYGLKSAVDFLIVFHEADDNLKRKYFAPLPLDWVSVHSAFDTEPKALLPHLSLALIQFSLRDSIERICYALTDKIMN